MSVVLVDSTVLLDVMTEDSHWGAWSSDVLERCAEDNELAINPIIYAEVSIRFGRIEDLDDALPEREFRRFPLPWEAGFLAGKSYLRYRRRGGARRAPLPDFYIGAHAAVSGFALLTRDAVPELLPEASGHRSRGWAVAALCRTRSAAPPPTR